MDFDCNTIKNGAQQLVSGVVTLFGGMVGGMVGGHIGGCVAAIGFGCMNEYGDPNLTAVKSFLVCAAVSGVVAGKLCRDTLKRCGKLSHENSRKNDETPQALNTFPYTPLKLNSGASAFKKVTGINEVNRRELRTGSGA